MKNKLIILFTNIYTIFIFGQVGIGTTNPISSAILDISSTNKGVLFPKVSLKSTTDKYPFTGNIPNGTLVFNEAHAGQGDNSVFTNIYMWSDGKWILPSSAGRTFAKVIKFTNSATNNPNINPSNTASSIQIPIFGNVVFNDDSNIYEKIDDYSIRIKQDGLYQLSTNLALRQNPAVNNSRVSDYIYFTVDDILASSKIITLVPQYNPNNVDINGRFAFSLNAYSNIKAGQILRLVSSRYKDGNNYNGTVLFDSQTLSSITVLKL